MIAFKDTNKVYIFLLNKMYNNKKKKMNGVILKQR